MSSFSLQYSGGNFGEISITSLKIDSNYDGHLSFSAFAPIGAGDELGVSDLENLIGTSITLAVEKIADEPEQETQEWDLNIPSENSNIPLRVKVFIDQITIDTNNVGQNLTLSGYSPTIFLDCAPGFQVFSNQTLYDIAETLLQGRHCPYHIAGKARNYRFDWVIQSQETANNLLKRLCSQTGVLECFFDGKQLVIDDLTNPEAYEPVLLQEGDNLSELSISFDTYPQSFNVEAYNYVADRMLQSWPQPVQSQSCLVNLVLNASRVYPQQRIFSPYCAANQPSVDTISRRMGAAQANGLVVIAASSTEASLRVGSQVQIDSFLLDGELRGQRFTVLSVSHHYQEPGMYSNTFTAIPSSLPFNLPMSYDKPSMGPLNAVVEEIKGDPEKLGRIRVSLVGDPNKSISPWLRLLQPGGWYAPPKVGDHVTILGEQFNPECNPVVLGSFYMGSRDAGFWEGKDGGVKHNQFECYTKDGNLKIKTGQFEVMLDKMFKLTASRVDLKKK